MKIEYCCEKMMRADMRIHNGQMFMDSVRISYCPFCGEEISIPCDQYRTKAENVILRLNDALSKVIRGGGEE